MNPMPAHVFDWIAVVAFVCAAIPYPNAVPWLALGLAFFALGHIWG